MIFLYALLRTRSACLSMYDFTCHSSRPFGFSLYARGISRFVMGWMSESSANTRLFVRGVFWPAFKSAMS